MPGDLTHIRWFGRLTTARCAGPGGQAFIPFRQRNGEFPPALFKIFCFTMLSSWSGFRCQPFSNQTAQVLG
jgi:hypothetical protein